MDIDVLIIGQGISGTWLSFYLEKAGKSFIVIDNNDSLSSSRLAAGVINPVTGRRHVEVWMANEILPFAWNAYTKMGEELQTRTISEKSVIDFFPSPQMRLSFLQRVNEQADYVSELSPENKFTDHFQYDFGAGEIKPVYLAHLENILPAWRNELLKKNELLSEEFDINELVMRENKVIYKDLTASTIIFCDGAKSDANPFFNRLPFAPNKGELLIVEIPDLPSNHIFKKGIMLVPLTQPGLWWVGSDYKWEFSNTEPTASFREKTEAQLKQWLEIPFKIIDHKAGVRPATLERRPFVGMHPLYPQIGILNGMGTKGCSLAPFFAKQLSDHLCEQKTILPEADINRFKKILSTKG